MFECLECWVFVGPRGQRARQRKGSPTTSCCRPLGASSRAASRSSWDGSGRSMVPSGRAKSQSYPRSAAWIRDGLRSRRESPTEPHALYGHPSGRPSPVAAVERGMNPISERSGVGTRPTCREPRCAPSSRAPRVWRILRHDAATRRFSTESDVGQRPAPALRVEHRLVVASVIRSKAYATRRATRILSTRSCVACARCVHRRGLLRCCERDRAARSTRARGLSRSFDDGSRVARAEQHGSPLARRAVCS